MDKWQTVRDVFWILVSVGLLVWVFCLAFRTLCWAEWIRLVIHLVPPGWVRAWLLGW